MPRAARPLVVRRAAPALAVAGLLSALAACGTSPAPAPDKPAAPAFTSTAAATFIVGKPADFAITTSAPGARVTEAGRVPAGLTFLAAGGGAELDGLPAAGTAGRYRLTISARDRGGHAAQLLAVTIMQLPRFARVPAISVTAGVFTRTSVTVTGFPAATVTESGALPAGLQFTVMPDGTAVISGTPAAPGMTETKTIVLTAANAAGVAHEPVSVTVLPPAPPPMMAPPPPPPMMAPPPPMMGGDGNA
jgi:Putative Ig domain